MLAGADAVAARLPWHEPYGSLAIRLDPLAALFLVPVLAVPALGSVYGLAYWPAGSASAGRRCGSSSSSGS